MGKYLCINEFAGLLGPNFCLGNQRDTLDTHPWQVSEAHNTALHELELGGLSIGHKTIQWNTSQDRPAQSSRMKLLEDSSDTVICPSQDHIVAGPTMDSIFDELSIGEYTSATKFLVSLWSAPLPANA